MYPGRARTARDMGWRALLWREYRKQHTPFAVVTRDGVELRGVHLKHDHATLLIYCHGFLGGKNYAKHWVELLAADVDVIAFDFRGHGESGGATTLGEKELFDLDAVMAYARSFHYARTILMGSSMGGAVVIRYAAEASDVDGVITMGAFAHQRFSPFAMGGLTLLQLPFSKQVVQLSFATRMAQTRFAFAPRDYIARISPRPLLVLHGGFDPLIPTSHARELYAGAGEPKQLHIIPHGPHDLENLNARTKERIVEWLEEFDYV